MAIESVGGASASLEIAGLRLAQGQQEQEGQASLELLESAGSVAETASDLSRGGNIDTFA